MFAQMELVGRLVFLVLASGVGLLLALRLLQFASAQRQVVQALSQYERGLEESIMELFRLLDVSSRHVSVPSHEPVASGLARMKLSLADLFYVGPIGTGVVVVTGAYLLVRETVLAFGTVKMALFWIAAAPFSTLLVTLIHKSISRGLLPLVARHRRCQTAAEFIEKALGFVDQAVSSESDEARCHFYDRAAGAASQAEIALNPELLESEPEETHQVLLPASELQGGV